MASVRIPVIALDGPSGAGKGTIARQVAEALGWHLLDSGALYRVVGLAAQELGLEPSSADCVAEMARTLDIQMLSDPSGEERILLDGRDVTGSIRTEEGGRLASAVAQVPAVREALLEVQRDFRKAPGSGGRRPRYGYSRVPGRGPQGVPHGEPRRAREEAP